MASTKDHNTYDDVPYPALSYGLSSPDRLATLATLHGLIPPSIERCRVLELGCADGSNIIPLAEALPQIVWTTDAGGKTTYFNERWFEFTGLGRDSVGAAAVIHPDDLGAARARWEASRADGSIYEIEYRLRHADGTYRWQLARALPVRDEAGSITGWVGTATDIEGRRRAEERQRFLAEAGWVLGSSLDYEQTLADVARLAVPRVADWCAVDIFVGDRLERLALEHVDPLKLARARA